MSRTPSGPGRSPGRDSVDGTRHTPPGAGGTAGPAGGYESYLVDGECGCDFGVVDRVSTDPATGEPVALRAVRGWRRRPVDVPVRDVLHVWPAERRMVVACPPGHGGACPGDHPAGHPAR
jgi:hypothetical protein